MSGPYVAGQAVDVWAFQRWRRGRVLSVGPKRIRVAFMMPRTREAEQVLAVEPSRVRPVPAEEASA